MKFKFYKQIKLDSKILQLYKNDNDKLFIKKQASLNDYETIFAIKNIAKEQNNLMEITALKIINEKVVYFVPLYNAITLQNLIDKKVILSKNDIRLIIFKICKGLQALHSHNIIHRDIKPDNIILLKNDVKIIDYNISRIHKNKQHKDTKCLGTNIFAPPEQYGFNQTTFKSDIYSLGITINFLVTNCAVEDTQTYFWPIIKKCTFLDPEMRYQSIDQIINNLTDNELFPEQIKQINELKALEINPEMLNKIISLNFNDKQLGVIKHAFKENIPLEIIELMLDNHFSSRQMWQIKAGYFNNLDIFLISLYAKAYFSPEEMAIIRVNLSKNLSLDQALFRAKNYLYTIYGKDFSEEKLKEIRNYFYEHDK